MASGDEESGVVTFRTSGSTGVPKTVVKTEASLRADAACLARTFTGMLDGHPTVVSTIQPHHMYGQLWRIRLPEAAGCPVDPAIVLSPDELSARVSAYPSVLFVTTPSFLEKLVADPAAATLPRRFAGIVTSGSLLRKELAERVAATLGRFPVEIFGSTETGSVAWRSQGEGEAWRVFDGVSVAAEPDGRLRVDSPFCETRPTVMGDGVELLSPRSFLLKGRMDRCVKILEKMVSLPQVEAALQTHPYLATAHAVASDTAVQRIWVLATLSEAGRRALKQSTYHDLIRAISRSVGERLPREALFRRIRFVSSLPYNPQGKLTCERVLPILKSPLQEPVVEGWQADGGRVSATLTFIPDAVYFQGHFPGFPVLPGVTQLFFLQRYAEGAFGVNLFPGRVTRLKFLKPILPRQPVHMEIVRLAEGRFSFTLASDAGEPYTSGVFECGTP